MLEPRHSDHLLTPLVRSAAHLVDGEWEYARFCNPTVDAVAARVARLEGAAGALLFSSGTAALVSALLAVTEAGQTVVASGEVCADAHRALERELPRLGRRVVWTAAADLAGFASAVASPEAGAAYAESISNPGIRVAAVDALAAVAADAGRPLVVDGTLATPVNQRALELGAELVVHSAGKYLNGHGDLVAGAVAGRGPALEAVRELQWGTGACLDAGAASLLERGLRTLELRMQRHNRSAAAVARRLARHPQVEWLRHPALPDHPDAAVAGRVLSGGSGLLAFRAAGGPDRAERLMAGLRTVGTAPTLGGLDSLAYVPALDRRAEPGWLRGLPPGLVRLSVGVEPPELIAADIEQALERSAEPA